MTQVPQLQALSIGSITLDVHATVPAAPDAEKLQFALGDKIPIAGGSLSVGGGGANVAVGLQKLGLNAGVVGVIGDQVGSQFIQQELLKQSVSVEHLIHYHQHRASFSIILNTEDHKDRVVLHSRTECPQFSAEILPTLPSVELIFTGHLYPRAESILFKLVSKKSQLCKYWGWNPGKTQFAQGVDHYATVLPQVDLLILNREEAELFTKNTQRVLLIKNKSALGTIIQEVTDSPTPYEVRPLAEVFLQKGVGCVVITDGTRGSQLFTGDGQHFTALANPAVPRVSTLGAGDATTSGTLAALAQQKDYAEVLRWGSANAESAIGTMGAQGGLLTKAEMNQRLS